MMFPCAFIAFRTCDPVPLTVFDGLCRDSKYHDCIPLCPAAFADSLYMHAWLTWSRLQKAQTQYAWMLSDSFDSFFICLDITDMLNYPCGERSQCLDVKRMDQ
jgi:hypothetical protein